MSKSSDFRNGSLSSYVEVVIFLLTTYAAENVIVQAARSLENCKQSPRMARTDFCKRLYAEALHCDSLYEEKRVRSLSIDGLEDAVSDNFQLYRSRNPSEPLTEIASYTYTVIKIADSRRAASNVTNEHNRDLSSNRSRSGRRDLSLNVSGKSENQV